MILYIFIFIFGIQGNLRKGFGSHLSYLLHYIHTLSIYPYAHKQLRRHLANPFLEFPCIRNIINLGCSTHIVLKTGQSNI